MQCIEHLLSFLQLDAPHVHSKTVIVLKDFLRKYPQRNQDVIPSLSKVLNTMERTEGKIACMWMVGEDGETIEEVILELLTATMQLFFKRPPELQKNVGEAASKAIKDRAADSNPWGLEMGMGANSPSHAATTGTTQQNKIMHVDACDRALLDYRLLQYGVHDAASVANRVKAALGAGGADGVAPNYSTAGRQHVGFHGRLGSLLTSTLHCLLATIDHHSLEFAAVCCLIRCWIKRPINRGGVVVHGSMTASRSSNNHAHWMQTHSCRQRESDRGRMMAKSPKCLAFSSPQSCSLLKPRAMYMHLVAIF